MTKNPKAKRIIVNLLIIAFLSLGTFAAIQYAKGYRPNLKDRSFQGSGLLNVTSYPKSARVIINDKLTTITDDKLYLAPGSYNIKIEKDGFHPWSKNIPLKSELVSNAEARLFPIITATSPLSFYLAENPSQNPDGSKIAYVLKNAPTSSSNGLYVHSLTSSILGSQSIQITDLKTKDFSKAMLIWSPDSSQILAVFTEKTKTGEKITSSYLLSTKGMNIIENLTDATLRLPQIISQWQDEYAKINLPTLSLYPEFLRNILSNQSINVYFSPNKEKVIYTPTTTASLPANEIGANLPNINQTPQARTLTKNQTYLFDLKEGTNYLLPFASPSAEYSKTLITKAQATPSADIQTLKQIKLQTESYLASNISWYSNSSALIVTNKDGVNVVDYDGLNLTNITYVIPKNSFAIPSPDGSKLILLTNINQKADIFNLISFDLK